MFSAILAVLFAIKILASHSQIYRLPNYSFILQLSICGVFLKWCNFMDLSLL